MNNGTTKTRIFFKGLDTRPLTDESEDGLCEYMNNMRPQGPENNPYWTPIRGIQTLTIDNTIPDLTINVDTHIYIYFDSSGSMNSTLTPLQSMRDNLLKARLLPLYNNDEEAYDAQVVVQNFGDEQTFDQLQIGGATPEGNVIVLLFQDESNDYGVGIGQSFNGSRTATYDTDIAAFRTALAGYAANYYRAVIFQVEPYAGFKDFITAVKDGTGNYSGSNGLSDKTEIGYVFDVQDGGTDVYYLNLVVAALEDLGFTL